MDLMHQRSMAVSKFLTAKSPKVQARGASRCGAGVMPSGAVAPCRSAALLWLEVNSQRVIELEHLPPPRHTLQVTVSPPEL